MKTLLIILCVIIVTLSSCSESMAPCSPYNSAYKLRSPTYKKISSKRARNSFHTAKL